MYCPPGGFDGASSKKTYRAGFPESIWLRSKTNAPAPLDVNWPVGNSFAVM